MTIRALLYLGCKLEEWLFQTRTPVKEVAFWCGWLTAASIFTRYMFQATTIDFNGEKIYKADIVKDNEYREVAVVLGACQMLYLIDSLVMAWKKGANYIDSLTYINELAFWTIVAIYGFLFDGSKSCDLGLNIFPCVFRTEIRLGRWPFLWILPTVKLVVDLILFIFFRFWQKRLISYSHGQSVVGILLDVQYLLVSLWISDNFASSDTKTILSKKEIYDAKLVFVILFKASMAAPLAIIFCVMLAYFDFKRGFKMRGTQWTIGAVGAFIAFLMAFFLDATIGSITAEYREVCQGLCTAFICIAGIYALLNIYFKFKTGYGPYLQYFNLKTYPALEKCPILLCSQPIGRAIPSSSGSQPEATAAPVSQPQPSDSPAPTVPAQGGLQPPQVQTNAGATN